ncbi:MAG: type IX secretion system outer membrane channel protein PorV [Prevotellaceae bacterium]|jgi:hypothetical protein|nr:type IX secretion system outer membrane channel protein PorV [Prevotellaceae bacterium]
MLQNTFKLRIFLLFWAVNLLPLCAAAQGMKKTHNPIQVAVPILNVAPDARGASMGDMGVATSPDVNSQHWNAAKYPFALPKMGVGLSYVPWLAGLVSDVSVVYLSYFNRVDNNQSVSGSIRYFRLGEMAIVDDQGIQLENVNPYECSIDVAYARKFGEHLSGSLTLRYIRSDLTGGFYAAGLGWGSVGGLSPANGFGADVGMYYQNEHVGNSYGLGWTISNMGTKVSYSENAEKYSLPTNLRVGGRYTYNVDEQNSFTGGLELSKLLVPTPPEIDGNRAILMGMDNNVSVVEGMIQSFYDAPYGAGEELSEVMFGFGVEYAYNNAFFARGGYFHDSKRKGNRRYLTFGAGIKYTFLTLDLSYLYPFTTNDPLSNTLRVSLLFDLNVQRVRSGVNSSRE